MSGLFTQYKNMHILLLQNEISKQYQGLQIRAQAAANPPYQCKTTHFPRCQALYFRLMMRSVNCPIISMKPQQGENQRILVFALFLLIRSSFGIRPHTLSAGIVGLILIYNFSFIFLVMIC
jgi:hypothetical protein